MKKLMLCVALASSAVFCAYGMRESNTPSGGSLHGARHRMSEELRRIKEKLQARGPLTEEQIAGLNIKTELERRGPVADAEIAEFRNKKEIKKKGPLTDTEVRELYLKEQLRSRGRLTDGEIKDLRAEAGKCADNIGKLPYEERDGAMDAVFEVFGKIPTLPCKNNPCAPVFMAEQPDNHNTDPNNF